MALAANAPSGINPTQYFNSLLNLQYQQYILQQQALQRQQQFKQYQKEQQNLLNFSQQKQLNNQLESMNEQIQKPTNNEMIEKKHNSISPVINSEQLKTENLLVQPSSMLINNALTIPNNQVNLNLLENNNNINKDEQFQAIIEQFRQQYHRQALQFMPLTIINEESKTNLEQEPKIVTEPVSTTTVVEQDIIDISEDTTTIELATNDNNNDNNDCIVNELNDNNNNNEKQNE